MSLIIDHVNFIYNPGTSFEKNAIRDVSLVIPDGEFIGLIGHTGSGKSTLIQLMNGLLKPSSGAIYYDGVDIWGRDFDRKGLCGNVGLVFQYPEYQLFETTVIKDVFFGPTNLGLPKLNIEMRSYEALKAVGIDESLLDASPFDLSGGQKRRVAIAGVLAMQPKILILDEPAAGLDPQGRREILGMLAALQKEKNITVILVSHSMEDVAEYVDRIIVMNKGSVAMDDTPVEVFSHAGELAGMGLDVPEISKLMQRLQIQESGDIFTIDAAYNRLIEEYSKATGGYRTAQRK